MKLLIVQLQQIKAALEQEKPATEGSGYLVVARSALAHAIDAITWEAESREKAAAAPPLPEGEGRGEGEVALKPAAN